MLEPLIEVAIFTAKTLVVLFAFGSLALLIALLAAKASHKPELEIEPLHKKYKQLRNLLRSLTIDKRELKHQLKEEQKLEKKKHKDDLKLEKINKAKNKDKIDVTTPKKRVFVLNFNGDTKASQVDQLREEITALLTVATPQDEVVAKVESPGGVVHGYGLAASQLMRIRERNIPLTVCVDKVAASGGYLMSCVASQIVAAPFAIIGSVGVVAQVPNLNRVLKKHDVDFKEYTAGEFKRTVSLLGEITPKGEAKFMEQLESTHDLFKKFVHHHRPQLDLAKISTGEYWYGEQAIELGLIDKLQTSDDYLMLSFGNETPIFELKLQNKQGLSKKISDFLGKTVSQIFAESAKAGIETTLSRLNKIS